MEKKQELFQRCPDGKILSLALPPDKGVVVSASDANCMRGSRGIVGYPLDNGISLR